MLRVVSESSTVKGTAHEPANIVVKNMLGEGSFGTVFEGMLDRNGQQHRVVLKRVKQGVQGADEMAEMEHLLNVYTARAARSAVADFLGYCDVTEADTKVNRKLSPGLWLVWRYEGANTLAYYLRRRDCLAALGADLAVPQEAVAPTVMKQVFEALSAIHTAGVVHRDVKPHNIVFSETERRFKLIDLGAAADLRNGTNYVPNESILDPLYCAPEQYIMPTQSPDIGKMATPMSLAMSPLIWSKWNPDRFDMYSAGLVMMQLALPRLRTPTQLRSFNTALEAADYDLYAWREKARLPIRETAILDENKEAGWKLAAALLRPRRTRQEPDGHVSFVGGDPPRPSAQEAAAFAFVAKGAAKPGVLLEETEETVLGSAKQGRAPGSKKELAVGQHGNGGLLGAASLFRKVADQLFDIEAKLVNQASATQVQAGTVRKLREEVAANTADPQELEKAEKTYAKMQWRLGGLAEEFEETAGVASGLMAKLGLGKKAAPKAAEVLEALGTAVVQAEIATPEPPAPSPEPVPKPAPKPVPKQAPAKPWPLWAAKEVKAEAEVIQEAAPPTQLPVEVEEPALSTQPVASPSEAVVPEPVPVTAAAPAAAPEQPLAVSPAAAAAAAAAMETVADVTETPAASPRGGSSGGGFGAFGNAFARGLKFTAMALTAATDLVGRASRTAEEVAAEAAARRRSSAAFVEAVSLLQGPAVTADSDFDEVMQLRLDRSPGAAAWSEHLTRGQLRDLFTEYCAALGRAAEADFRKALRAAGVGPDSTWDGVVDAIVDDVRYAALGSEEEARRVFGELVAELRGARQVAKATEGAERGFRQLLLEMDSQLLVAGSWSAARRVLRDDVRYAAVDSDARCRELFKEAVLEARAHAGDAPVPQAAKPAPPPASTASRSDTAAPMPTTTPAASSSTPAAPTVANGKPVNGKPVNGKPVNGTPVPAAPASNDAAASPSSSPVGKEILEPVSPTMVRRAVAAKLSGAPRKAAGMLTELREQHARLRKEYEMMEAKLRAMEDQLSEQALDTDDKQAREAVASDAPGASKVGTRHILIQQDPSGSITFRLGDEPMPGDVPINGDGVGSQKTSIMASKK